MPLMEEPLVVTLGNLRVRFHAVCPEVDNPLALGYESEVKTPAGWALAAGCVDEDELLEFYANLQEAMAFCLFKLNRQTKP